MRIRALVVWGSIRTGWPRAVALLALTALLAMGTTVLFTAAQKYTAAVRLGAAASFGGYRYQLTGGGDGTQRAARHLTQTGKAIAVVKGRGALAAVEGTHSTIGTIIELSGPSRFGQVVSGHWPSHPGEISVSQEAARQLGVTVGSQVDVDSLDTELGKAPYLLTAITENPAGPRKVFSAVVSRSSDVAQRAQMWLMDSDPAIDHAIGPDSQVGNARIGRIDWAEHDAVAEAKTRELSGLPWYEGLLLAASLVSTISVLVAYRPSARKVADSLEAAGQGPRAAGFLSMVGMYLVSLAGAALGIAAALAFMEGLGSRIGAALGQVWPNNAPVSMTGVWFIAAESVAAVVSAHILVHHPPRREPLPGMAGTGPASKWLWLTAAGSVMSIALLALRVTHIMVSGHIWGTILGAVCLPVFLWNLPWLQRTPKVAKAVRWNGANLVVVLNVLMLLVTLASYRSASLVSTTTGGYLNSKPSDNYIIVESLTANDVSMLGSHFPGIMGNADVFIRPDETQGNVRVTEPSSALCLRNSTTASDQQLIACNATVLSTVELVDHNGRSTTFADHARPGAIMDGKVGILRLRGETLLSASVVPAAAEDARLSNDFLPGFILAVDSPVAKELGLSPSIMRDVYIPDFANFPDSQKDAFRSQVISQAGYAFVTEPDNSSYRQMRATAFSLPCLATILAALVSALAAVSAVTRQRVLRMVLHDVGVTRWGRIRLVLPTVVPCAAVIVVGSLMGRFAAIPALPWTTPLHFDYGWYWAIPIPVAMVTGILLAVAGGQDVADGDTEG